MNGRFVSCSKCNSPLPETFFNTSSLAECPECGVLLQAEVFPALYKPIVEGQIGETILVDGEAGCFYHPQKRAAVPCSSCGRFLCALCDVELNDQHLCPGCLETGQKKGKLSQLETRRTLYDSAALSLALIPLLLWPFTIVTAPTAIILAIYSWRKPSSLVPRTRIRACLAIIFGLLQITGWVLIVIGVSTDYFNRH